MLVVSQDALSMGVSVQTFLVASLWENRNFVHHHFYMRVLMVLDIATVTTSDMRV